MHGFFRFEARRPNNKNSSGFLESPLAPITDDFYAKTCLPDETELTTFMSLLDNKGRTRLNLKINVKQGDKVAMTFKELMWWLRESLISKT